MIPSVVGNFPKIGDSHEKQKLRRAVEAHQQGKVSQAELAQIENEVTEEVVQEQIRQGIQLITDGQIRWTDPLTWLARKLQGIKISGLIRFFDTNIYYRQPVVESEVKWVGPILVSDFEFAKKIAGNRARVKAVLPGPYSLARLSKNNHYPRFEDLVLDLARALGEEAKALEKAGATFIQFDEPSLPFFPEDFHLGAKALLSCTRSLASLTKTAVFFYFSPASKIFSKLGDLPVHVLGLDLVSNPEMIKLLQQNRLNKELALGLVDARNTKMEKEEDLQKLLGSLEKNQENLHYVNPSCGLEFLPYDIAVQKLKLVSSLGSKVALRG